MGRSAWRHRAARAGPVVARVVLTVLVAACAVVWSGVLLNIVSEQGTVLALVPDEVDGSLPTGTSSVGAVSVAPSVAPPRLVRTTTAVPGTFATTTVAAPPAPPRSLTFTFTGDVLPHTPVLNRAAANGAAGSVAFDFAPMFSAVEPILAGADRSVCHLETPIVPEGRRLGRFPLFGSPPELIDGLAAAGFDACSTASNHTLDQGVAGIDATVDAFARTGLAQAGMARTPQDAAPTLVDIGDVTVAHISATYWFNGIPLPRDEPWRSQVIDADRMITEARTARDAGADIVIVSLHWGNEYSHDLNPQQRDVSAQVMESGVVDLIVGHHAHVVQPIEQVAGRWVIFGLGNFLSGQSGGVGGLPSATQDGAIARVRFVEEADGFVAERPEVIATWVDRDAGYVVRPVDAALADAALGGIHGALEASRARSADVLGDFLVAW
jgi:hypothetical protein